MASDRASPPALRWVALFLAVCAGLGLWMGFKDQMRRNPPDWYTGSSSDGAAGSSIVDTSTEAKAYDPSARNDAPVTAATPAAKVEEKKDETDEATDTAQAATGATPAATTPATPGQATPPTTPRPKPPTVPRPSDDPVGDILDAQKPAPEQPPVVPY